MEGYGAEFTTSGASGDPAVWRQASSGWTMGDGKPDSFRLACISK